MKRKTMQKLEKYVIKTLKNYSKTQLYFQNFCLIFRPPLPGYSMLPGLHFGHGGSLCASSLREGKRMATVSKLNNLGFNYA